MHRNKHVDVGHVHPIWKQVNTKYTSILPPPDCIIVNFTIWVLFVEYVYNLCLYISWKIDRPNSDIVFTNNTFFYHPLRLPCRTVSYFSALPPRKYIWQICIHFICGHILTRVDITWNRRFVHGNISLVIFHMWLLWSKIYIMDCFIGNILVTFALWRYLPEKSM